MMRKDQRAILERMAQGWRPLYVQLGSMGLLFIKKGWVRATWGPKGSTDYNRLCVYLTDAGRDALAKTVPQTQREE